MQLPSMAFCYRTALKEKLHEVNSGMQSVWDFASAAFNLNLFLRIVFNRSLIVPKL